MNDAENIPDPTQLGITDTTTPGNALCGAWAGARGR